MNEFERRFIDLAQNHRDLMTAAKAAANAPVVRYFGYSLGLGVAGTPLVNGQTYTGVIPIQADSAFVAQGLNSATVFNDGGIPNVFFAVEALATVNITDTGSGDLIYSGPVRATLAAGGVQVGMIGIPLLFPTPRVIPANSNVRVEMTYLGAGTEDLFYMTLNGARVEQV